MMDYYSILGVPKTIDADSLKIEWLRIRSKAHPDKGGDAAEFNEKFNAYRKLLCELSVGKVCDCCDGLGVVQHFRGIGPSINLVCKECGGSGELRM